jgi:nucleoside-diphosphate-sugar epimerase
MRKVVITGAAGLVGQNLVVRLRQRPDIRLVGIDKHSANVAAFRRLHPGVEIVEADLARDGSWSDAFDGADAVVVSHAQIGGTAGAAFEANNVAATRRVLEAVRRHAVPYFVGISSSVVNSRADDPYSRSKAAQEALYDAEATPHSVLRPTLMFGWFDRKHLGWLRRFMDRTPVFPIPGDGNYARQPLYAGDFVSIVLSCLDRHITGTYDISGLETLPYGELIGILHAAVKPRARLVRIPYRLFWGLLWVYGLLDRHPPFTTSQLEALVIPETFPVIDWPKLFGVAPTPLRRAISETYLDPTYAGVVLEF